jgi:hypothetical protein
MEELVIIFLLLMVAVVIKLIDWRIDKIEEILKANNMWEK